MDYDYSKRGYLLPDGCKDLMDVIHLDGDNSPTDASPIDVIPQEDGLMVILQLPGHRNSSIEIIVEGSHLSVCHKLPNGHSSSTLAVPPSYELARAHATYIKDTLRIFIPKC